MEHTLVPDHSRLSAVSSIVQDERVAGTSRLGQGPSSARTPVAVEHAETPPSVRGFVPPRVTGGRG